MTYYINPIIFYLADIAETSKTISIISAVFLGIGAGICIACVIIDDDCSSNEEKTRWTKYIKRMIVGLVLSIVVAIATPSSDSVNKMIVASCVTEENVGKVKEGTIEIVDYIIEKARELRGEE